MRDDLPTGISADVVEAIVASATKDLDARINRAVEALCGNLADDSDEKRVARLPALIQQLCHVDNWPIVYAAGTFELNLRRHLAADSRYYPNQPTQEDLVDDAVRFTESWITAFALRRMINTYASAAIRKAAELNPPMDPAPLLAFLRRTGWSDSDGGALAFADDLARRVAAVAVIGQTKIEYIDLDQAAALVNRHKRTLERYQAKPSKKMPLPAVQGVGGKKSEWDYATLKPWLEKEFSKLLPPHPPHVGH